MRLKLIQTYLSNRKQYVQGGNAKSFLNSIISGIAQGSILGQLFLFNIYERLTKFRSYENYTFCG